jgi:hypothetical protein
MMSSNMSTKMGSHLLQLFKIFAEPFGSICILTIFRRARRVLTATCIVPEGSNCKFLHYIIIIVT